MFKKLSLLIFILASIFVFSNSVFSQTTQTNSQAIKLEVPKIYLGQNFLTKKEIFRYEITKTEKSNPMDSADISDDQRPSKIDKDIFELNRIVGVYAGNVDNEKGTYILAAGDTKAFILDLNGKVKREIHYNLGTYSDGDLMQSYDLPFISFADVDNDGKIEIIGHGIGITAIVNLKGQILWKYKIAKKNTDPDDIVINDIDGDGKNEIIVAIENRIEVYEFATQKLKWSSNFDEATFSKLTPGKLQVADFNGDRKKEILAGESLLDANGKVIKKFEFFFYLTGILIQKNKVSVLLDFEDNKLNFTDLNEKVIRSYEAPLSDLKRKSSYSSSNGYRLFSIKAVPVKLSNSDSEYLAILADANDEEEFDYFKMLYVYNSFGILVYQETIQASYSEIGILPNHNGTESLIITDDGKVNIYTLK